MMAFTHPISFVKEAAPFVHLCWEMGWNEANGGNFSWRLPTGEIEGIFARHYPELEPGPSNPLPIDEPALDGEYFLVTGSGQFFRHGMNHPNQVFGIVQIVENGTAWRKVWGFNLRCAADIGIFPPIWWRMPSASASPRAASA